MAMVERFVPRQCHVGFTNAIHPPIDVKGINNRVILRHFIIDRIRQNHIVTAGILQNELWGSLTAVTSCSARMRPVSV